MIIENYKKIVGNGLKTASNPLFEENTMIANPTEEILNENGYYLVEETPMPENVEGYYWSPVYSVVDNKIIISWEQHIIEVEDDSTIA